MGQAALFLPLPSKSFVGWKGILHRRDIAVAGKKEKENPCGLAASVLAAEAAIFFWELP
jgi:hypothetical protein